MHIWRSETDSEMISNEHKALILVNELLENLNRNIVSTSYQILTLKLLVNYFGLNILKYDTWNADFATSESGEYDTNENIFLLSMYK